MHPNPPRTFITCHWPPSVASYLDMLATRGTRPLDNLSLCTTCGSDASSSEHYAPPVVARTDRGRPGPLLNGWNRNLRPIDLELNDSEDKSGRVSAAVTQVVNRNLNQSRTSLTILCHISEPIAMFTSTKQLIEAIRDAMKGMLLEDGRSSRWLISQRMNIGHKILAECGLFHQDISANSVFLTKCGQFKGFLHDLDYSIYAREWGQPGDCQLGTLSYGIRAPRKVSWHIGIETCHESYATVQGTFEFMARDILDGNSYLPKHDLESFFWLLASITICPRDRPWSLDSLKRVVLNKVARDAGSARAPWLEYITLSEDVRRNKPLMQLLDQLAHLVLEPDVDHTCMLRVFEDALDSQGWPEDDANLYRDLDSRPNYYQYAFQRDG